MMNSASTLASRAIHAIDKADIGSNEKTLQAVPKLSSAGNALSIRCKKKKRCHATKSTTTRLIWTLQINVEHLSSSPQAGSTYATSKWKISLYIQQQLCSRTPFLCHVTAFYTVTNRLHVKQSVTLHLNSHIYTQPASITSYNIF